LGVPVADGPELADDGNLRLVHPTESKIGSARIESVSAM
jgi:hypothetical protein